MASTGEMELVLNNLEKLCGLFKRGLIVGGQCKDLPNSQIHPAFAGANVADAFEHLIEIVRYSGRSNRRIFQPLIVYHKTFDQIFLKRLGCPLTELCTPCGADAITNGENNGQTVVKSISTYFTSAFQSNL